MLAIDEEKSKVSFRKTMKLDPVPENLKGISENHLHELRDNIHKGMTNLLDKIDAEKRDLSNDEENAYTFAESEWSRINAEIEERKNPRKKLHMPNSNGDRMGDITGSRTYRGLFKKDESASLSNGGFDSFKEFVETVTSGRSDSRLNKLESRTHIAGTGALGGFAIPEEFASTIFNPAIEASIIPSRAAMYPMLSDTLNVPSFDFTDNTAGLFGGFSGDFLGENTTATEQTGKLRNLTLRAKKMGIYTSISREASNDGIGFDQQLRTNLVKAINFYLDRACIVGQGVTSPIGILNSASCIGLNRATPNQIAYSDIVSMYSRLHPACMDDAIWIASHSALPQLMSMVDNGNHLIWSPAHVVGAAAPVPMTIFGKPLIFTEKVPALGTKGDLILCSPSQFALGMRQDVVLDVSNAPGWLQDIISLRVILRFDFNSLWWQPVTPMNGGDSLSCAVTLNA